VGGVAVGLHGIDQAVAGIRTIASGQHQSSFTSMGIQRTGVSQNTADLIDGGISIVGSGGIGLASRVSTTAPAVVRAPTGLNAPARTTPQLALPAPKVVPRDPFHHIFPQRADLAAEFKARGINPHEFTMQVPKPLHQQIHSGGPRGGQWNQAWDDYFKANPSATATDVYKEAGRLIYQFDVPGGPVVPYPR
jgi:hypothetical protein